MYGNNNIPFQRPFNNVISQQSMYEQIDNEINNLQQMKKRMENSQVQQQPTSINQTFQIAPTNNNGIKIVNSIDDVQKELAITDTPFIDLTYSTLWIKNAKGEIRTFELKELKAKDEKDLIIENLQLQINELKGKIDYEQQHNKASNEHESEQFDEPIKNETASNVSNAKPSKSKSR